MSLQSITQLNIDFYNKKYITIMLSNMIKIQDLFQLLVIIVENSFLLILVNMLHILDIKNLTNIAFLIFVK